MAPNSISETHKLKAIGADEVLLTEPGPFLQRLGLAFGLATLAVTGIALTEGLARFSWQILLALMMAHGTELAHQCLHKSATGHGPTDRRIGTTLSWPTGIAFLYYRFSHLWHHRENGSERDRESFGYVYAMMLSPSRSVRFLGLLRHLSHVDHFVAVAQRLYHALNGTLVERLRIERPEMSTPVACDIQSEYRRMAMVYAAALSISPFFGEALFEFWVIPLLLWGPIHALVELPEHWATGPRPNRDGLANTRNVTAGRFLAWYTNGNNDHVAHHLFPRVQMHKLPIVTKKMAETGVVIANVSQNYAEFYRDFIKHILWNK